MFTKNTYLNSPSSLHHSRHDLNGNEILLHHHHDHIHDHHQDLMSGSHYLSEAAALFNNQEIGGMNNGEGSGMLNSCPRTPKRDRHSKINTAQGPRDRRVRLSIGVARKFFDLQEMLGFDKPSKTLDWLLTKSKAAIKDLVAQTKQTGSNGVIISSPSDECEVEHEELAAENGADLKGKSVNKLHKTGGKDPQQILAKESRVKARARARERTREKMCFRNNNSSGYDLNPLSQLDQFCRISGGSSSSSKLAGIREATTTTTMAHYPQNYEESATGDLIQESIVIKRKVKHPASILGFQPNLISNYNIPSPYNATENWESNLYAYLDQYKFNNSSSN